MEEPGIPILSFHLCLFLNAADGESSGQRKKIYLEVTGEAARMGSSSDEHLVFQTPTLTAGGSACKQRCKAVVGLYFSLHGYLEGCEWVSVESDCRRDGDKKQTEEDGCTANVA